MSHSPARERTTLVRARLRAVDDEGCASSPLMALLKLTESETGWRFLGGLRVCEVRVAAGVGCRLQWSGQRVGRIPVLIVASSCRIRCLFFLFFYFFLGLLANDRVYNAALWAIGGCDGRRTLDAQTRYRRKCGRGRLARVRSREDRSGKAEMASDSNRKSAPRIRQGRSRTFCSMRTGRIGAVAAAQSVSETRRRPPSFPEEVRRSCKGIARVSSGS